VLGRWVRGIASVMQVRLEFVHACRSLRMRTRRSGTVASARALLDGMAPECKIAVHDAKTRRCCGTQRESTEDTPAVERDPVFGAEAWAEKADHALLAAAIPWAWAEMYCGGQRNRRNHSMSCRSL